MKEYANEKFFHYLEIVQEILEEGQREGIFRKGADPVILKRAIFGAVDEMALEWVLMKKKRYSMDEAAEQLCEMFVKGLLNRSG
jgi:TetR/AcrR family fatty acid metabolism transcriptional regulator